jgi:hypothetical protein
MMRVALVSTFVMVTVALPMAAPLGSVTVPEIDPVMPWLKLAWGATRTSSTTANSAAMAASELIPFLCVVLLAEFFISIPPEVFGWHQFGSAAVAQSRERLIACWNAFSSRGC